MPDNEFKSSEDFLAQMDSGKLDGDLTKAIKKLSSQQLDEVASTLLTREPIQIPRQGDPDAEK